MRIFCTIEFLIKFKKNGLDAQMDAQMDAHFFILNTHIRTKIRQKQAFLGDKHPRNTTFYIVIIYLIHLLSYRYIQISY